MEFAGAMVGSSAGLGLETYALALLFAVIGGVISRLIVKNCKPGDYVHPTPEIIAQAAQPLPSPVQITLTQEDKRGIIASDPWEISLNGQPMGHLTYGSSLTVTTSWRQNILCAKNGLGDTLPPYVFDVSDEGMAEIHFRTHKFLPKQSKGVVPSIVSKK